MYIEWTFNDINNAHAVYLGVSIRSIWITVFVRDKIRPIWGMRPLKKDPSNSWSHLKNYDDMYKIVYSSDTRDLSKNIF